MPKPPKKKQPRPAPKAVEQEVMTTPSEAGPYRVVRSRSGYTKINGSNGTVYSGWRHDANAEKVCAALNSAHAAGREEGEKVMREAIAQEPELPGPMPDELLAAYRQIIASGDKKALEYALRLVVVQTKQGILKRYDALTPKEPTHD